MYFAFRRYLPKDSLDKTERAMAKCLGHRYSTVYVVLRVPCPGDQCPYCPYSADPNDLASHDVSFGVTRSDGMIMSVDKLYNRSSAKYRRKGGDRRWMFVHVPLGDLGSSEALARKVLLPFFKVQMDGCASFDTFGSRWGYLLRSMGSLGLWHPMHLCLFLTHTPSALVDPESFTTCMGPLPNDSSVWKPSRSWFCSELAMTCLHLLGIANGYDAQLTSPTNLFVLCGSFEWPTCTELFRRASRSAVPSAVSIRVESVPRTGRRRGALRIPEEYAKAGLY